MKDTWLELNTLKVKLIATDYYEASIKSNRAMIYNVSFTNVRMIATYTFKGCDSYFEVNLY